MSGQGGAVAQPIEMLLVEDNPTDAEVALRALRKAKIANNVIWVKDGEEALEFLRSTGRHAGRNGGAPKVVLLDLRMPKKDGLETLQEIRSDPQLALQPVVMLTSSREESDLLRSYSLGVNSYIVKPVDFSQLTEQVAKLGYYWLAVNQPPPGSPSDR